MSFAGRRDEWGHEKRGDQPLFEKLSLEGAQAGLSWATILAKREGYRKAFYGFDIAKCAAMSSKDIDVLLASEPPTIVRHRGKLESVVNNARCILELIEEAEAAGVPKPPHGHFDAFVWSFVNGTPKLSSWEIGKGTRPTMSPMATEMAMALKRRGFRFVGPTCMYSFCQSCGLIIDHPKGSAEWEEARRRLATRATPQESTEVAAEEGPHSGDNSRKLSKPKPKKQRK